MQLLLLVAVDYDGKESLALQKAVPPHVSYYFLPRHLEKVSTGLQDNSLNVTATCRLTCQYTCKAKQSLQTTAHKVSPISMH